MFNGHSIRGEGIASYHAGGQINVAYALTINGSGDDQHVSGIMIDDHQLLLDMATKGDARLTLEDGQSFAIDLAGLVGGKDSIEFVAREPVRDPRKAC